MQDETVEVWHPLGEAGATVDPARTGRTPRWVRKSVGSQVDAPFYVRRRQRLLVPEADLPSDDAERGFVADEDRSHWSLPRWSHVLAAAGLASTDAVIRGAQGSCLRVLPDRENWLVELPGPGQPARRAFLKKHRSTSRAAGVLRSFGLRRIASAGRAEARAASQLQQAGIGTMRVIAWGEKHRESVTESFLLTEELDGYLPLDEYLRQQFSGLPPRLAARRRLLRLITTLARLTRRLHGAGFNHRDLYCCHVFVKEMAGRFDLRLIDLQRTRRRRFLRKRWLIKDLAQLAYSAPSEIIGGLERWHFLRQYIKRSRPGWLQLWMAFRVAWKWRYMEWQRGPSR